MAEQQQRTQVQVDNNARAIEAATESISTLGNDIREGFSQTRAELQASTADVVSMINDLAEQQNDTDQRFQVLLEEARADRSRMDQHITQARQDGLRNTREHRAFTQTMQSMLAEIARIWQRLAG
ncbi:MAG: hypothetical protein F6J95_020905 [Leptolyngbya sp. SIO1E4]|nr:hypothetical protein [Leptolyngbya sp. SIO1E4]